jgi:hypothetical protein
MNRIYKPGSWTSPSTDHAGKMNGSSASFLHWNAVILILRLKKPQDRHPEKYSLLLLSASRNEGEW